METLDDSPLLVEPLELVDVWERLPWDVEGPEGGLAAAVDRLSSLSFRPDADDGMEEQDDEGQEDQVGAMEESHSGARTRRRTSASAGAQPGRRESLRERTLQLLRTVGDADAEAMTAKSSKQLWRALQRKIMALREFRKGADEPDAVVLQEELTKLPMFASLPPDCARMLSLSAHIRTFGAGQMIKEAGSPANSMIVVLRGIADLLEVGDHIAALTPGRAFGQAALLGLETVWPVSIRAMSTCVICDLSRREFFQALQSFPAEMQFFRGVARDFQEAAKEPHMMNTCDLLRTLSRQSLQAAEGVLLKRLVFPGEVLVQEGKPGDELFILVKGSLSVTLAGRLLRREMRFENTEGHAKNGIRSRMWPDDPICFGELGLLGLQEKRTSTVVADSVSLVRVLHQRSFRKVLEKNSEHLLMDIIGNFMYRRHHAQPSEAREQRIREVGIFRDLSCTGPFLDFLAQHLEDRIFIKGQKIINEDSTDDRSMYIMVHGNVEVIKNEHIVAHLGNGTVIGEIAALGLDTKRSATVVAKENCYVHVLHQSMVVRGMELFPEDRRKLMQLAFKRMAELGIQAPKHAATFYLGDRDSLMGLFTEALKVSEVFKNLGMDVHKEIAEASTDRIYMPGDLIVEEGKRGTSMFVMMSGTASVLMRKFQEPRAGQALGDVVGSLGPGSMNGELAMLGILMVRPTTIKADTICTTWEIPQERALPILERHHEARKHFAEVIRVHLASSVPSLILMLPLLHDFDKKIKTYMALYSERRVYFPGMAIVKEGIAGERLVILHLGRATLERKGITIKTYDPPSYFGSNTMLGDPVHKTYLGTLLALQTCHVIMISRALFLQALEKYPQHFAANRLVHTEHAATEDLNRLIQNISTRKLVWKRYGAFLRSVSDGAVFMGMSKKDILQRFFTSWQECASQRRGDRDKRAKERDKASEAMERWLQRKKDALVRAEQRHLEEWADVGGIEDRPPGPPRSTSVTPAQEVTVVLRTKGRGHDPAPDPIFKDWPQPKPSPFYSLKVWDVIAGVVEVPSSGLLPRLSARGAGPVAPPAVPAAAAGHGDAGGFPPLPSSARQPVRAASDHARLVLPDLPSARRAGRATAGGEAPAPTPRLLR